MTRVGVAPMRPSAICPLPVVRRKPVMQRRRYSWTSCSLPMPRTSSSTDSSRVVMSRTARSTASRVSVVYGPEEYEEESGTRA